MCACLYCLTRAGLIVITHNFLEIGGALTWWEYQMGAVYDIRTIQCEIVHINYRKFM